MSYSNPDYLLKALSEDGLMGRLDSIGTIDELSRVITIMEREAGAAEFGRQWTAGRLRALGIALNNLEYFKSIMRDRSVDFDGAVKYLKTRKLIIIVSCIILVIAIIIGSMSTWYLGIISIAVMALGSYFAWAEITRLLSSGAKITDPIFSPAPEFRPSGFRY